MMNKIVITADVIDSQKQTAFSKMIRERLKDMDIPGLEFPFALSRGDEIQGILPEAGDVLATVRRLRYSLKPLEIRVGIGFGPIEEISGEARTSWDLTGEAFFGSREALDKLKDEEIPKTVFHSGEMFKDLSVNSILALLDIMMNDWTDLQFKYVIFYEKLGTYEKVGKTLNVSAPNVQKACKRANWETVSRIEENVDKIIWNAETGD